jgi:ketosteroid isomerase-like protein
LKRYDTPKFSLIIDHILFKPIMKELLFLCAILFVTSCSAIKNHSPVDVSTKSLKQEVEKEFQGLAAAIERLDMDAYLSYFDDEKFSGLNADGTNWTSLDALKAVVMPGFAFVEKVESLTFPHVHISVIDNNTVILVNEYEQVMLLKSGSRVSDAGGGTQVWSKSSGQWKLVSVSASAKPKE